MTTKRIVAGVVVAAEAVLRRGVTDGGVTGRDENALFGSRRDFVTGGIASAPGCVNDVDENGGDDRESGNENCGGLDDRDCEIGSESAAGCGIDRDFGSGKSAGFDDRGSGTGYESGDGGDCDGRPNCTDLLNGINVSDEENGPKTDGSGLPDRFSPGQYYWDVSRTSNSK